MKKLSYILLFLLLTSGGLLAQVIETEPGIPTRGQLITIYFNSDQLSPTDGLYQYEGVLYAHTGVTLDGDRWQNVIEAWGNNTTQPQLTYLGSYRYKLDITPDIEHYYTDATGNPISEDEVISEICLVIRNATSSMQTSPDIFIDVFEAGLEVNISSPTERSVVQERYTPLNINVSASLADSILLFIDEEVVKKEIGSDQLTYSTFLSETGGDWVHARAYQDLEIAVDSFYYYVPDDPVVEAVPEGIEDGINYISDTDVTLVVTAPGKERAFVVGDFNDWIKDDESYMKQSPDGKKFWIEISDLVPGQEYRYQYLVDDITIADPYAEKVLDPWNDKYIDSETYPSLIEYPEEYGDGIVGVLQTDATEYEWQTSGYTRPDKTNLVIYELLLRDFLAAHNYQNLIDTLSYLGKLGINAIELMPVNEFDDNESWGYNPSYYFAPDKYYGTKDKLKEFIDSCHARGIAVIVDMVLNHATGSSPMAKLYWDEANNRTAADNPWFNVIATHDYNVFHDFNHESDYTRYHAKRVMKHWVEEYKVDGYRFDLSKGFTQNNTLGNVSAWGQYDASRVAIWEMYADYMWSVDPDTYIILEHFADNSEEKVLSDYGMMLWGNSNYQYSEAAKGYDSDISWIDYEQRGWTYPYAVGYMESHDEERMMYRLLNEGNIYSSPYYSTRNILTALKRVQLAATFFFTVPGPKMIWQFGELGYDYSINYDGRVSPKPILWNYNNEPPRKEIYDHFSGLIYLKTNYPAINEGDFTLTQLSGGRLKRINISHSSMDMVVIGNFDVVANNISGEFTQTGYWYDYLTGDSLNVVSLSSPIALEAGEARLYTTERLINPGLPLGIYDIMAPEIDNNWFSVYPNPLSDFVTINISDDVQAIDMLEILGFDGRVVYSKTDLNSSQLDLSGLDEGLYFLRISSGNKIGTKRIIKIK